MGSQNNGTKIEYKINQKRVIKKITKNRLIQIEIIISSNQKCLEKIITIYLSKKQKKLAMLEIYINSINSHYLKKMKIVLNIDKGNIYL